MALTNSEVVRRFFRFATIALSVASAGVMLSASGSTGSCCDSAPAGEVSYSDFNSFTFSMAVNFASAVLQMAAAYLKWNGDGGKDGGEVVKSLAELIDAVSEAFLASSSGLSLSVDNFGKCGRRLSGICKCSGLFCQGVHRAGYISIAAAIALAVSQYLNDLRELEEEAQGQ